MLIVLYKSSFKNSELEAKLSVLGDIFILWQNIWLIETELTPKELYNKINRNNFDSNSFFIAEIKNEEEKGYYGLMKMDVWNWLKDKVK